MTNQEQTIWVAKTLFERGLVTGSTGNISYRDGDIIYISKSGGCFGLLDENGFASISIDGKILEGKPSKEWPMHLRMYQMNDEIHGVVHTHSFHSTLYSCREDIDINDLFMYTPYLMMQTGGKIGIVEYAKPGSDELFANFDKAADKETKAYLLRNHGIFAGEENILKAFYLLEEFEQSSRIITSIDKDCRYIKI